MLAAVLTVWTAWRDRALILASPTPAPIVAGAAIAAVYFLLAWLYRSPGRTWTASLIALAGTVHALNFNYFPCVDYIGPNWTIALLGHATLALLAVLCLDRLRSARGGRAAGHRRSAGQLRLALVGTGAAGAHFRPQRRQSVVGLLFPLAGRCVVGACPAEALGRIVRRPPGGVGLRRPGGRDRLDEARRLDHPCQAADRAQSPGTDRQLSHVLLDPRNLQAYGIALGLLSLVWVVARIIDRPQGHQPK